MDFALCGGRPRLRALDGRRLLKKPGENFKKGKIFDFVCTTAVIQNNILYTAEIKIAYSGKNFKFLRTISGYNSIMLRNAVGNDLFKHFLG